MICFELESNPCIHINLEEWMTYRAETFSLTYMKKKLKDTFKDRVSISENMAIYKSECFLAIEKVEKLIKSEKSPVAKQKILKLAAELVLKVS